MRVSVCQNLSVYQSVLDSDGVLVFEIVEEFPKKSRSKRRKSKCTDFPTNFRLIWSSAGFERVTLAQSSHKES